MGTDIHPVIEVRRDGRWQLYAGEERPYRWNDVIEEPRTEVAYPDALYNRNYRVFAVLADVRNGYGFAGAVSHDVIEPITSERGIPDDFSGLPDMDDLGDHSFGWASLAEIEAFPWKTATLHQYGVLSEVEFLGCLIERRTPGSWAGGVSGPGVVTLTPAEWLALWGKVDFMGRAAPGTRTYDPAASYYIAYDWDQPVSAATDGWDEAVIPYLRSLVPDGGSPDDVRLVFGFDS